METYAHPGTDWSVLHRLLASTESRARQVIAQNLDWLRQLLAKRGGDLMFVSKRGEDSGIVGAVALSHEGSAVVVHFYVVAEGAETTTALASLYKVMVEYARRHQATVLRIPAFLEHAMPSEHQFYGRLATVHLDGPWQSGDMVRTYSIPLEKFFAEAAL